MEIPDPAFTIIVSWGHGFRAHGIFASEEEAEAYIKSGAAIRRDDGEYEPFNPFNCAIVPLTTQG